MLTTIHLGHEFITDVLELRFDSAEPLCPDTWLSLCYAVQEGATEALQIRRDDLDGTLYQYAVDQPPAVVLFDTVPGGAGHVHEIQTNLRPVLEAALRRVEACDCEETTSCYECLRSYRNQIFHDRLQRGPVRDYLKELLASIYGDGGLKVRRVPDRRLWLGEQLARAQELHIAADSLAPVPVTDLPGQPSRDWLLLLRNRQEVGTKIKLALREWPKSAQKGGDAVSNALIHELAAFASKPNVELYELDGPVPDWTVGLLSTGSERSRVVRWTGSERRLLALYGDQEIEISEHPDEVHSGLLTLEEGFQRWTRVKPSDARFSPAEVGAPLWVPEGGTLELADYLSPHLPNGVLAAMIEDPYLVQPHQIENLLEFGEILAEKKAGNTLTLVVFTSHADIRLQNAVDPGGIQAQAFCHVESVLKEQGIILKLTLSRERSNHSRRFVAETQTERLEVFMDRGLDIYHRPVDGVRTTKKAYLNIFRTTK